MKTENRKRKRKEKKQKKESKPLTWPQPIWP
jgi:hypothetical protein